MGQPRARMFVLPFVFVSVHAADEYTLTTLLQKKITAHLDVVDSHLTNMFVIALARVFTKVEKPIRLTNHAIMVKGVLDFFGVFAAFVVVLLNSAFVNNEVFSQNSPFD